MPFEGTWLTSPAQSAASQMACKCGVLGQDTRQAHPLTLFLTAASTPLTPASEARATNSMPQPIPHARLGKKGRVRNYLAILEGSEGKASCIQELVLEADLNLAKEAIPDFPPLGCALVCPPRYSMLLQTSVRDGRLEHVNQIMSTGPGDGGTGRGPGRGGGLGLRGCLLVYCT